jgi:hypothetical protein
LILIKQYQDFSGFAAKWYLRYKIELFMFECESYKKAGGILN